MLQECGEMVRQLLHRARREAIAAGAICSMCLFMYPPQAAGANALHYRFAVDGVLEEAPNAGESTSPYFWLNSGGQLHIDNGTGSTIVGRAQSGSLWNTLYKASNALDTQSGAYPQNLFRLVTKQSWRNTLSQVRFKIDSIHETNTPNRDGYSGILLMSRYQNGDTLYYAGIRMDGAAVIKKKYRGTYTTLAQRDGVFSGNYDWAKDANLIPEDKWMRLKSETITGTNGVAITLWIDRADSGKWEKVLSVTDTSKTAIREAGHAGIRTDYMDVYFDDYKVSEK